ncbi:MAG: SOS response-associated peptidase family protein [Chitinophagaceae bacterium]|nr:SOS response-associated peptidase family protein [Chitinophagaceae bacterium]
MWHLWADFITGEHVETFSIVTTRSNEMMKQVHKSKKCQPTILTEVLTSEWLFGDLSEERNKKIGQFQLPANKMADLLKLELVG